MKEIDFFVSNHQIKLFSLTAHDYPIYGTQWHPEMNPFEFNVAEELGNNINHSPNGIRIAQYFANFFVNEARKNFNSFATPEEERDKLFYNYKPVYSAKYGMFPEQQYVFDSKRNHRVTVVV